MLKITVHSGDLVDVSPYNRIGSIDVAYARNVPTPEAVAADKTGQMKAASTQFLADYLTLAFIYGLGETEAATLEGYPRWAGSTWDLIARCIALSLYRVEAVEPMGAFDGPSAYATAMSVVVESVATELNRGHRRVAQGEIRLVNRVNRVYEASFDETINVGVHARFTHRAKRLVPLNLLMRALCWALWQRESLGPRPAPISLTADAERVDLFAVAQPARGGFMRWLDTHHPGTADAVESTGQAPTALLRSFLRGDRPAYASSRC